MSSALAEERSVTLSEDIFRLQNILKKALARNAAINFDKLKKKAYITPFQQAAPALGDRLPARLSQVDRLIPWKRAEHAEAVRASLSKQKSAEQAYQEAKQEHEAKAKFQRKQVFEHNKEIEQFKADFHNGLASAISRYFRLVLETSEYPKKFPQRARLDYQPQSQLLTVKYELPPANALPKAAAFPLSATGQPEPLYKSVLVQIALRSLYEIFQADTSVKLDKVIFNGYVKASRPATSQAKEFCLLAVSAERHQILSPTLGLVEPLEFFQDLQGRLSSAPEQLQPVQPLAAPKAEAPSAPELASAGEAAEQTAPPAVAEETVAEVNPNDADYLFQAVSHAFPEPEAAGNPIPPRSPDTTSSVWISPPGLSFVREAEKYVDRIESQGKLLPFSTYVTSYKRMHPVEEQWYFYWRGQLRAGKRMPTDALHLYIHIYEVLNIVGFETAQAAYEYLVEFWKYYRELQLRLDYDLPNWIADFIVLHDLAPNALQWYADISKIMPIKDRDLAIEAWLKTSADFADLSLEIIFKLARYNPRKNSTFYKKYAESAQLDAVYKKALAAVDVAMQESGGKSLFRSFQPWESRVISRSPFRGALHAYPVERIEIAKVHLWSKNAQLADTLKEILRFAENIARQQNGYRHRLRKVELEPRWQAVIEAALKPEASKPRLTIDYGEVQRLAQASAATRQRLLADDDSDEENPPAAAPEPSETVESAAPETTETRHETAAEVAPTVTQAPQLQAPDWLRLGYRRKRRVQLRAARYSKNGLAPANPVTTVAAADGNNDSLAETPRAALDQPTASPAAAPSEQEDLATMLGTEGSKPRQLIALLKRQNWQCATATLEAEFPGEFISVIIETINEAALAEIDDTVLVEEGGQWQVLEEYRAEIEALLPV